MLLLNNKDQLLELMTQGAVVITPNNRLSVALLESYYKFSAAETVSKPQCIPYTVALVQLFENLRFNHYAQPHPVLLNEAQCRHLWRMIIKDTSGVTYNDGLLNAVIQAWTYCEQWLVEPNHLSFSYTRQTQMFQHWWQTFNHKIQRLNALNEHQLTPYFINRAQPLFNKSILVWACFDEFTPQQQSLQQYLHQHNMVQYRYDLHKESLAPQVFAAGNEQEEYQQLIHWLHSKIEQKEQRIGIVIPDLQQQAQRIKRSLTQHIPVSLFNISLGEPLNNYPLVAHALNWLHLEKQCSQHEASLLLQSPYLGAAKAEFAQRAQILQDCSLLQQPQCSLDRLKKALRVHAPQLAQLIDTLADYPLSATPHEWIALFQKRLNRLGYPGDYGLNSAQYQCYQRFVLLFDEFRQLALISPVFTRKDALDALTQLAKQTIFQAQSTDASIQISGLLEASGCEFDSLWVMGLTDHCLPAKTSLSAFIPPQLQRDLCMPHSSSSRELNFAQQTLQRLQKGSNETIFSYAKLQGDRPALPSALISQYPPFTGQLNAMPTSDDMCCTEIEELYNIPFIPAEHISGGTSLLANQAKCPFKAFAEHRLAAKPMPKMVEGIDNKERGTIIHKIMELLWRHLKTQAALCNLQQTELAELITQAIEQAQATTEQLLDEPQIQLQHIERTRLQRLALACLEWEKQRPAFAVKALEQSYTINLAGLEIKLRIDRLDQVDDKLWIIDYKSTLPANKPWNEDRPQEPQLLLYALLNEDINALLFIQVKTGKILCSGLSEHQTELKGISPLKKEQNWSETRDFWQQQLTTIAHEVQAGHCAPQPISSTVCSYCDFKNLCRMD